MYRAVEGPIRRPLVLSMINGSYCRRRRRRLTIFEPDEMKFGVSLGFAPQFRTKVARVRFWNKGSWRLWFGIWVLYFHRMLNITYQVLEVDWPSTLSAKIGGQVTWVICYLPPMEIMEFFRIADVLSAVFQLDQHFLSWQWWKFKWFSVNYLQHVLCQFI